MIESIILTKIYKTDLYPNLSFRPSKTTIWELAGVFFILDENNLYLLTTFLLFNNQLSDKLQCYWLLKFEVKKWIQYPFFTKCILMICSIYGWVKERMEEEGRGCDLFDLIPWCLKISVIIHKTNNDDKRHSIHCVLL